MKENVSDCVNGDLIWSRIPGREEANVERLVLGA